MWDYQTWKFDDIDNRFSMYRGSKTKPPKPIHEAEIGQHHKDEILKIPVELKPHFDENPVKALKDYGGIPAFNDDKLIDEPFVVVLLPNLLPHIFSQSGMGKN